MSDGVAPARERGLKFEYPVIDGVPVFVAPARERGLKFERKHHQVCLQSRSREGAWIEILKIYNLSKATAGRSREGAWIEITKPINPLSGVRSLPRGSVD